MYLPRMTTRRWMMVVLYGALELSAFDAASTWGMVSALGLFLGLTVVLPLIAFAWWLARQFRLNTLY
jgi:hypothetical protein